MQRAITTPIAKAQTRPPPLSRPASPSSYDVDEVEWSDEELSRDLYPDQSGHRLLPPAGHLISAAVLGVALALLWRSDVPRWLGGRLWPTSIAEPAQAAQSNAKAAETEESLKLVARELEALRKVVGDLNATQQQMGANIASLQAELKELRQRAATFQAGQHWYTDPVLMRRQTADRRNAPAEPASPPRGVKPQASTQGRSESAPLSLVSPRP